MPHKPCRTFLPAQIDTPSTDASTSSASHRSVDDVLTVNELAEILRVHPVTVRLSAAAGRIPGRQIGNRWRFSRSVISDWMAQASS